MLHPISGENDHGAVVTLKGHLDTDGSVGTTEGTRNDIIEPETFNGGFEPLTFPFLEHQISIQSRRCCTPVLRNRRTT
jgi:hypothetical protein